MTHGELVALRREAAAALTELQELPGYQPRFRALSRPPGSAADWPWLSVEAVCAGIASDVPRWAWRRLGELNEAEREDVKARVSLTGSNISRVGDGSRRIWSPGWDPAPSDDETLQALDRYRVEVRDFAAAFLLGARWSAGALHSALSAEELVRLPPGPPGPFVQATVETGPLEEGELVSAGVVAQMAESLTEAPERESELSNRGRETTWRGALDGVAKRLKGVPLTSTERSRVRLARLYMEGAVQGTLKPIPATDPIDFVGGARLDRPSRF